MNQSLRRFRYRFDAGAGPLSRAELEGEAFTHGNCRLAVQYFLFKANGLYLGAEDILLPRAYEETGTFVIQEAPIDWSALQCGDIVYAENRRNKREEPMQRGREAFASREEWVLHFHSAIFLGPLTDRLAPLLGAGKYPDGNLIWHSTAVEDGTCVWPVARFEHYYRPVSAKRVLSAVA